jgi:anti-anti-sigma factor
VAPDRCFVVDTQVADGTVTLAVRGEVDIATVGDLGDGLAKAVAARPARLVVDLAATVFIDCSGMEAIAQARQDAPPGCRIILRSPNRLARRMIELTGTDRICLIDP